MIHLDGVSRPDQYRALGLSTFAFTACFAVWTIFSIIGVRIKDELGLSETEFGILVAGYPEKHQEAPDPQTDLDNLKRKVDCGADAVVTQLFYDNDDFYRFRDACAAAGIQVPVVPGILPVTNLAQIQRLTSMCGSKLPEKLVRRLSAHENDDEGQFSVGVYHAARQVEDLMENGVPGVHFYVLNKSRATALICRALVL